MKAMRLPSGDQAGAKSLAGPEPVRLRTSEPSAPMTKILWSFSKAMRLPSGDHAGDATTSPDAPPVKRSSNSLRSPFPSAPTTQTANRLLGVRRPKAICVPSGDQAGEPSEVQAGSVHRV